MDYKLLICLGTLLFMVSCIFESPNRDFTYRIENTTNNKVTLRFYNRGQNGESLLSFEESIDGSGLIIERKLNNVDFNGDSSLLVAFGADSIAVIFDDSHVQQHSDLPLMPLTNSIFDPSEYVNDDTYQITERNLENATPCDGACE